MWVVKLADVCTEDRDYVKYPDSLVDTYQHGYFFLFIYYFLP